MRFFQTAAVIFLMIFGSKFASAQDRGNYQVGQVWEMQSGFYKGHLVLISHVEYHPVAGPAIHISVPGPIRNPEGKTQPGLPHFPFSQEGLDKTDLKLAGQIDSVPDVWKEGHSLWHAEVMKGKAGLFTVQVPEVIDLIFKAAPENP